VNSAVAGLQAYIDARRAAGERTAVLLVDCGLVDSLDAALGYAVGDAAHGYFASRLRDEALREQDLVIDVDRDRFACALAAVGSLDVAQLAAEKLLRALDAPLWVGDDEVFADPAVGIALVPEGSDDAVAVLGRARAACSVARERPERLSMYSETDSPPGVATLEYQGRLRAAIVSEAMEFLFQPQFDMRTGLLVGAACLLGWAGGTVPARQAIAAAHGARRVNEATRWTIGGVLRHCTELRQGCGVDLHVGVNISASDLHAGELAESILGLLKVWNLRPSRLALGISDIGLLVRRPQALGIVQALGKAGVRLGIDDPDAGLPELAQLESISFAELRLDRALMRGIASSPRRQGIVRGLAAMAHELRMDVLADGVDDAGTAACLKELGCDILQGEHIGPLRDAQGFIAAHQQ